MHCTDAVGEPTQRAKAKKLYHNVNVIQQRTASWEIKYVQVLLVDYFVM